MLYVPLPLSGRVAIALTTHEIVTMSGRRADDPLQTRSIVYKKPFDDFDSVEDRSRHDNTQQQTLLLCKKAPVT